MNSAARAILQRPGGAARAADVTHRDARDGGVGATSVVLEGCSASADISSFLRCDKHCERMLNAAADARSSLCKMRGGVARARGACELRGHGSGSAVLPPITRRAGVPRVQHAECMMRETLA